MKILFLHSGSDFYGASRSLVRLATALTKDGHSVAVWIPQPGPIVPMLASAGVSCSVAPELRGITRAAYTGGRSWTRVLAVQGGFVSSLARKIRIWHPDLIHSNTALILPAGFAARFSRSRHLWHVREWFGEFPDLWRFYQWYLHACADRVVCVSRAVAGQFHPVLRNRVRVVYNGFPSSEFEAVSDQRIRAFRSAFGLGEGPAVGVVGRIKWKRKGQEVFLQAASLLRDLRPSVRFLCIGSPFPGNEEHLAALQRLAAELGLAREWVVTGDVQDNLAAIAALDILVHPPAQPEPFSGAIVEAMALGKPVIGSDLGGTSEQIVHGETGLLVRPDDPVALASAIRTLLRDKSMRREMGARGRARYEQYFSWDPFYQSIRNEYSAIMRGPG
jgi:glycosyltransferase involved in cell wall biosynthesis